MSIPEIDSAISDLEAKLYELRMTRRALALLYAMEGCQHRVVQHVPRDNDTWCRDCGALRVLGGEWTAPRYVRPA